MVNKIRMYVDDSFADSKNVSLSNKQTHYLINVMRCKPGDTLLIFNNYEEWLAEIIHIQHRIYALQCLSLERTGDDDLSYGITLIFSPIKKERTDYIVEKATEMGVTSIIPVITEFTSRKNFNRQRLQMHAIEASEQCRRLMVPTLHEATPIKHLIQGWHTSDPIIFCDEKRSYASSTMNDINKVIKDESQRNSSTTGILIGPEGGFSKEEREFLYRQEYIHPISLGRNILRSDTAVISAIAITICAMES